MTTTPYRPVRGLEVSFNGDAQLGDLDLQDANLTQQGIIMRGPGARELAFRTHETGGTESPITGTPQALFWRPDVAGDELCMVAGDTLYTSKPTEITANGTQAWKEIGTWAPWTLRQSILVQTLRNIRDVDVATIRDAVTGKLYQVVVWEQPSAVGPYGQSPAGGVYAMALDESGGIVAGPVLLDSGAVDPKACACDTGVVIMYARSSDTRYLASFWMLTNPVEFTGTGTIVSVTAAYTGRYDLRKDGSNDRVIVGVGVVGGTPQIRTSTVTVSGVVTVFANINVVVLPTQGVAIDVDPLGGYLLTWASGTQVATRHIDSAGVPTTLEVSFTPANPIVRITGCHKDGIVAQGTVAVEQRVGASPDYRDLVQALDFDGLALTNVRTQRGATIHGHATVYRGRAVALFQHVNATLALAPAGTIPGTLMDQHLGTLGVVDLRTGAILGRAFPELVGNQNIIDPAGNGQTLPSTPQFDGGALWYGTRLRPPGIDHDVAAALRVEGTAGPRNPASVPGYALDAHAGFPVVVDGFEGPEADWHVLPTVQSITALTLGVAGLDPGATYVIAFTYLWIDRRGNFWRSAPIAFSVPLGGANDALDVAVQSCRWTAKGTVILESWRSEGGLSQPLYLEQRDVIATSVDTVTVRINAPDTAVAGGETLDQFAPGNVLAHGTVPVTDHMTFALSRFWSPDPGRPDIIRHTIERDISRDGFGWGWEDTQLVQLDTAVRPQAAGPIQGGMAIFAGNIVHMLFGLGPDKQGSGLFQAPLTTFGVVDLETSQAKIATIPDAAVPGGLVYATPRGLYLLQRDQLGSMLSRQVERLFRFDGVVPQAIAFAPIQGDVFMMTATPEARSLRFNVLTNRWCADSARRAQDVAVSPRGEVAWLLPDGRVRILDETLIADGDDDLVFRGTTPLIKIGDTVSQPVTVQGLLTHTYLLSGPAVVTFRLQDGRTGDFIPPLADPPFSFTYSVVGPQSIDLQPINMASLGMRVIWEQPAGDTGKIAIVELDVQLEPSSGTMIRTMQSL